MLRVAVPYGEISSDQLRVLARIAREYDQPSKAVFDKAIGTQADLGHHAPAGRLRPLHHPPERAVQLDSADRQRRRDGLAGHA